MVKGPKNIQAQLTHRQSGSNYDSEFQAIDPFKYKESKQIHVKPEPVQPDHKNSEKDKSDNVSVAKANLKEKS